MTTDDTCPWEAIAATTRLECIVDGRTVTVCPTPTTAGPTRVWVLRVTEWDDVHGTTERQGRHSGHVYDRAFDAFEAALELFADLATEAAEGDPEVH